MPDDLNTTILVAAARDKYGLVLTPQMIDRVRSLGAPVAEDGAFDPLDLAAWLTAAALGKTP